MKLRNENIEIHIDLPGENYALPRFDWTGKITKVCFQGIPVTGTELSGTKSGQYCGQGLYNEFGIETPVGFDEIPKGEWFHKIGVGALKKETDSYHFHFPHVIRPAEFNSARSSENKARFRCVSENLNGYAYVLDKTIELSDRGFTIHYRLKNTGTRVISTYEYNHNFLAINKEQIGSNYVLTFPFNLKPKKFGETVNPEEKVRLADRQITFDNTPREQFFFSNLSGGKSVKASWELTSLSHGLRISETGSFNAHKVNLWGWTHVISPELFCYLNAEPGNSTEWSRSYRIERLDPSDKII